MAYNPQGISKVAICTCAYCLQWIKKKSAEELSSLEQVLKKLVRESLIKQGRKAQTSFCIIDAQSVKNTDTVEQKGYNAGTKVLGINNT